jgi:hypothetical protein
MIGGGYFLIFRDSKSLTKCSVSALKKQVYQKASFIDAGGMQVKAVSVRKVGYVPPWFGYRIFRGRQILVDIDFEKIHNLTFEEVIEIFKKNLKKANLGADSRFYDFAMKSSASIQELFENLDR